MQKSVLHKAGSRGFADHGWLKARHTFSFANYYDPARIHFGVLRVLNDDTVAGGKGFGTHPHDNMEIITIPLEGAIEHKDSMGNSSVIRQGEIQVMSAGSGITHSEFNHYPDRELKLLQIWLFPNKKQVEPRYDQLTLNPADKLNRFQQIVSPDPDGSGVWIHQNAWFHLGRFDEGFEADYELKNASNGLYAFVIAGDFMVDGQELNTRDGLGLWNTEKIQITAKTPAAEILLMEVPMQP